MVSPRQFHCQAKTQLTMPLVYHAYVVFYSAFYVSGQWILYHFSQKFNGLHCAKMKKKNEWVPADFYEYMMRDANRKWNNTIVNQSNFSTSLMMVGLEMCLNKIQRYIKQLKRPYGSIKSRSKNYYHPTPSSPTHIHFNRHSLNATVRVLLNSQNANSQSRVYDAAQVRSGQISTTFLGCLMSRKYLVFLQP